MASEVPKDAQATDVSNGDGGESVDVGGSLAEAVESAKRRVSEIEGLASAAAERCQHIHDGEEWCKETQGQLKELLETAGQQVQSVQETGKKAADILSQGEAALSKLQTTEGTAQQATARVQELRTQAEEAASKTISLADIASQVEQKVREYESRLEKFSAHGEELLKKIESLLPGASSANLAVAFRTRKLEFRFPQRVWQGIFVLSVAGVLLIAFTLYMAELREVMTQRDVWLAIVRRLPLVAPLVWLALYAARQANLAKRLEEDYAFKEAVSASFEGYRKQIEELDKTLAADSLLRRFCNDAMNALSAEPGRIYKDSKMDPTPISAIREEIEKLQLEDPARGKVAESLVRLVERFFRGPSGK